MREFIVCLAAFCLLVWVVYLKQKINELNQNQKKLIGLLKRQVQAQTGDVDITTVQRGWGKRANPEEEDVSWVIKKDAAASKPNRIF